jgi:hypothetical protein
MCTDGTLGYNLHDAVSFLRAIGEFYNAAEVIWRELGHFFSSGHLELHDFIAELRKRLRGTWDTGLDEYAKFMFFQVSAPHHHYSPLIGIFVMLD